MYYFINILIVICTLIKLSVGGMKESFDSKFLDECVDAHNYYRRLHGSRDLILSLELTDYSRTRAKNVAKISDTPPRYKGYGENLFWYYYSKGYRNCTDAVTMWYEGNKYYDYNRPGFTEKSGGFSQVLWRNSKRLGCAKVVSDAPKKRGEVYETYIICNYEPAGNVEGQFPFNVYPKQISDEDEDEMPRPKDKVLPPMLPDNSNVMPKPKDKVLPPMLPDKSNVITGINRPLVINHPPIGKPA